MAQTKRALREPSPGATRDAVRVALVHDWLTGMRGGEKVLEVLCELYPDADLFTLVHRRGSRVGDASSATASHTSFVQRLPFGTRALPQLPAALPLRHRAVRPRRLRPGHQLEPLRGQGGRGAGTGPPHLLLPLADALRLGSVRGLLRAGAGGRVDEPLVSTARCWRGWRDGTRPRRRACTASWPTRAMLRGGSADTTIVIRRSCIRLSTPRSSIPVLPAPRPPRAASAWSCRRSCPYKRVDLAIDACALRGRCRCASSATGPTASGSSGRQAAA